MVKKDYAPLITKLDFPLLPLLVLATAFVLLLLTLSRYYQPSTTPTPTASPTAVSTATWQTYENKTYSFEISYPNGWTNETAEDDSVDSTAFLKSPDGYNINIYAINDNSKTIDDYLIKKDKEDSTAYEGQPVKTVISTSETTINSYPVVQRFESWNAAGFDTYTTYIKAGNILIAISIIPQDDQVGQSEKQIYDQILSTFTFIY